MDCIDGVVAFVARSRVGKSERTDGERRGRGLGVRGERVRDKVG